MSVTSRYREAWEGFWREAPDGPGEVFWDAGPERTAAVHLALFEPHLTAPDLPLVDLGCGNGTQTRYLADRFSRVIGADLSTAAVDLARRADPDGRAAYRVLDAADGTQAEALHADLGDANVYVRGVLHQCEPDDRQRLADTVATLLGERGRVCLVELAEAARPVLMGLAQGPGGPPARLAPVLRHGIAPGEVGDAAVPEYLRAAGLTLVAQGELPLITTEHTADGTLIELPSRWYVAGRTT